MSEDGQLRRTNRPPILNRLSDFANVFKAFVGVNYLTLPFAFKESGMILGIIGLFIIASITDHCCLLIVKCKRAAINKIIYSATCQLDVSDEDSQGYRKKLQERRVFLEKTMTYGDIGRLSMGKWGNYIVNAALILTQFSFCINYFIFIGDTITRMFPSKNETHEHHGNSSSSLLTTTKLTEHRNAPNAVFLMLIPFPFFVLQTYVRNIRSLGPLSTIANVCVFLGFFSILGYMLHGLDFGNIYKIELWKFSTFPIFFGQIISAYEGIGTIIPIEASMKENRPNFPMYLHGAILGISLILGTFGIFGYLHYMDNVEQVISDNLEYGTLSIIVQVTLCIGILFTYPLQMFPVVEIIENFLFKETKARDMLVSSVNTEDRDVLQDSRNLQYESNNAMTDNEQESFQDDSDDENDGEELPSIVQSNLVLITKPRCGCDMSWSTWKRNIVRTVLVIASFGLGYLGRNYFAYISALSGSVGSSLLAFILPCCFHLIIKRNVLPIFIVAKDVLLILFGIIAGLVGFVTTLIKIIKL